MKDKRAMDVAKNIYTFRKKKGYTQEGLAERIGTISNSIYKWEAGVNEPRVSYLYAMADVLDVDVSDFFRYRGEK